MKATHKDYLHPSHLRVEDGIEHKGWSIGRGWFTTRAFCMAPSCSDYARLNKASLPKWAAKA